MQKTLKILVPAGAALLCACLIMCAGCSKSSDLNVKEGAQGGAGGGQGGGAAENLLWSAGELYTEMQTNADLVVLDCRAVIPDAAGVKYTPYDVEHLEGSYYLNYFDFGDPYPDDLNAIITTLSNLGLLTDTTICLYDESIHNAHGKVFYNLERLGCTDVHVLDGGMVMWKNAGGAVTADLPPDRTPTTFIPAIDNSIYAELDDMKLIYDAVDGGSTDYTLTDYREPPLFYGHKICPDAARHGHMPNTASLDRHEYFNSNTGQYKSPATITALSEAAGLDQGKTNVLI